MHWQIVPAILLGILFGSISGANGDFAHRVDGVLYGLVGDIFMASLKMITVPLVMASILAAMIGLGNREGFARMGGKTLLFYTCTSFFAIMAGLFWVNTIAPGAGVQLTADEINSLVNSEGSDEAAALGKLEAKTEGKTGTASMWNVIKEVMPSNIFAAMAGAKMLGLIVVSLLFGYFAAHLEGEQRRIMHTFIEAGYNLILKVTFFILRFLPLGVLALIAEKTADATSDGTLLTYMGKLIQFVFTTLLALGTHLLIVLPVLLLLFARVNPLRHYQAVWPAMMTAFSTASSSATLPVTIDSVEQRAGVSKRVSSFVLPVGATVNMDGTALYECVAVLFLAQLFGIELNFAMQALVVTYALLTSIGVAGIPSASLVAIVIIINAVNTQLPDDQQIPYEALALILLFDRILDMCRTAVNVTGDSVGAVIIARSEGEETALTGKAAS